MLTRHLLFAVFAAAGFTTQAQNETLSYVVLANGEQINGSVAFNAPIMKPSFVLVDDVRLKPTEVGLLRNKHGVFANVSHLNNGQEAFAMRVKPGKISVFERVDMSVYGKDNLPQQLTPREESKMLAQGRMDYLMDEVGNVYTTKYRDLKDVYAYSDASMAHVKRMQRYRWVRGILAGAGGLLTGVGIVQAGYGAGMTPALVMGAVGVGSNFLLAPAIKDARWQALDTYNSEP